MKVYPIPPPLPLHTLLPRQASILAVVGIDAAELPAVANIAIALLLYVDVRFVAREKEWTALGSEVRLRIMAREAPKDGRYENLFAIGVRLAMRAPCFEICFLLSHLMIDLERQ